MADTKLAGGNMAYYRVYLLNTTDCIVGYQAIDRDSDDEAVAAAVTLIDSRPAVEVWAGARKVARLTADDLERMGAASDGKPRE